MQWSERIASSVLTLCCAFPVAAARADDAAPPAPVAAVPEEIPVPDGLVVTERNAATAVKAIGDAVRGGADEWKCFRREEWRQMGQLVIDYRWLLDHTTELNHELTLRAEVAGELRLQRDIARDALRIADDGRLMALKLYEAERQARQEAMDKGNMLRYLLIGAAVVEFAALAAVSTGWYVSH